MPSLNIDLDFFDHPKTRRLVDRLGRGAEAMLVRMWCYTAKYYSETGRLTGLPGPEIEAVCRWEGEKGKAVKAMVECGWLDQTTEGDYQVHDWQEHEGHIATFHARAVAAVAARERKRKENNGKSSSRCRQDNLEIDKRAEQAKPRPVSPPDPLSIPHPKSITGQKEGTCGKPAEPASPAGAMATELIRFPLPGAGELPILDTHLQDWQRAYPGVDIPGELAKMRAWLLANPKRRKTRTGMGTFINNWLSKAQNRAGSPAVAAARPAGPALSTEARELGFHYLERHEPSYGQNANEAMKDSFCAMNATILQQLVTAAGSLRVAKRALDLVAKFKAGKPWQLKFIGDIWPEFVGNAMKEGEHAGAR